jgi:SAM-dependent methyltransferase
MSFLNKLRQIVFPSPRNNYHYEGYDIPLDLMHLTGGGPDTFDAISTAHIQNIDTFVGLKHDYSILEIGCGIGRDAIPLTKRLSPQGNYFGIDIIGPSIIWCNDNITKAFPNFQFKHYDVKDELHNPRGSIRTQDISIPIENRSVDIIILQSVFTHLLKIDILHYLKEFERLLKPSGRVYATLFIYNEQVLTSAQKNNLTIWNLKFEHLHEEGCRINDIQHPTGAVAYTQEVLVHLLQETGLKLSRPLLKGAWSGHYADPEDGQDVAIIELASTL